MSLSLTLLLFSFQFVTSVVSCSPAELKREINGKKETLKGFNVKLQDTILFPEGGGQVGWIFKIFVINFGFQSPFYISKSNPPVYLHVVLVHQEVTEQKRYKIVWFIIFSVCCFVQQQPDDHGLIGDVQVLRVTRQGPDAIHFVCSSLEVGQEVLVKVDWERRFDHMQQHSGENHFLEDVRLLCMFSMKWLIFKTEPWKDDYHLKVDTCENLFCFGCYSPVIYDSFPRYLGQHLITALTDTMFGYKTTSW